MNITMLRGAGTLFPPKVNSRNAAATGTPNNLDLLISSTNYIHRESGPMKLVRSIGAAVAVLLMSGCAMASNLPADPRARIAEAKKITQHEERDVVSLLPEREVESVDQIEEGSFLSCSGGYLWSGSIRALLRHGVDAQRAQVRLAEAARAREYNVSDSDLLAGGKQYQLTSNKDVQLFVTVWDAGKAIQIDSASPCFGLPDNYDRPWDY